MFPPPPQHTVYRFKTVPPSWNIRDGSRSLIEKGWNCQDYLHSIICMIGDHEASVIDTVLCAIENARYAKERMDWAKQTPHDR